MESVKHLFFDCCVGQSLWVELSKILGLEVGNDFESLAKLWLSEKCFNVDNVCNSAALWTIWKMRNDIIFQGDAGQEQKIL
jgi:hypothetical protein